MLLYKAPHYKQFWANWSTVRLLTVSDALPEHTLGSGATRAEQTATQQPGAMKGPTGELQAFSTIPSLHALRTVTARSLKGCFKLNPFHVRTNRTISAVTSESSAVASPAGQDH